MKQIVMPAISQQYIRARVRAFDVDGNETDPTNATATWAFTVDNSEVQVSDWQAGDWETGTDANGKPQYYARYLQEANVFTAGVQYAMWLKVDGVTEAPVMLLGNLNVV
jgi:hypothetical protein